MKVALIDFDNGNNVSWTLGPRIVAGNSPQEINSHITLLKKSNDYIFFFNSKSGLPSNDELAAMVQSRGNLWHGGKYANGSGFSFLSYIKPCWMLNLAPVENIECVSWKINCHCALIPVQIFERYGLLHEGFASLEAAFQDWGYNFINHGGIPVYKPEIEGNNSVAVFDDADQILFLQRCFPVFWIRWALWRAFSNSAIPFRTVFRYWNIKPIMRKRVEIPSRHQDLSPDQVRFPTISVVIITLNRYRFLKNVIKQLSVQTVPVTEIIVVDASPPATRDTAWATQLTTSNVNLRVMYSEVIGQCTQRNIGIDSAVGELVYFCDDDMEQIPPDHLERHVKNLVNCRADVSCGLPDEVGISLIDREKLQPSVSTVFPTNDSLVFKSILYDAGLFDTRMDKGQNEDHDLGIRCFLKGGLMILDPALKSLHLRAGVGGLREHGTRVVTAALSKSSMVKFKLLHHTEIYLNLKYFSKRNVKELLIITLFATFRQRGSLVKKLIKFLNALFYLPFNFIKLRKRFQVAIRMVEVN